MLISPKWPTQRVTNYIGAPHFCGPVPFTTQRFDRLARVVLLVQAEGDFFSAGDHRSGGHAMRHKLRLFRSILLLSSLNVIGVAQQNQVEPMEKTTVFRTNVVTRSTKAVDYRHRGGSTKVDLRGT